MCRKDQLRSKGRRRILIVAVTWKMSVVLMLCGHGQMRTKSSLNKKGEWTIAKQTVLLTCTYHTVRRFHPFECPAWYIYTSIYAYLFYKQYAFQIPDCSVICACAGHPKSSSSFDTSRQLRGSSVSTFY